MYNTQSLSAADSVIGYCNLSDQIKGSNGGDSYKKMDKNHKLCGHDRVRLTIRTRREVF
jgi:hypothetical protein